MVSHIAQLASYYKEQQDCLCSKVHYVILEMWILLKRLGFHFSTFEIWKQLTHSSWKMEQPTFTWKPFCIFKITMHIYHFIFYKINYSQPDFEWPTRYPISLQFCHRPTSLFCFVFQYHQKACRIYQRSTLFIQWNSPMIINIGLIQN